MWMKHLYHPWYSQVIGMLMSMLFSLPLDWDKNVQHVETFAGCASVTRGEMEVHPPNYLSTVSLITSHNISQYTIILLLNVVSLLSIPQLLSSRFSNIAKGYTSSIESLGSSGGPNPSHCAGQGVWRSRI